MCKNLDFSRRKSEGILTYFKLDNVEKADFCHLRRCSDTDATAYANATREQALIIATRMVKNLK